MRLSVKLLFLGAVVATFFGIRYSVIDEPHLPIGAQTPIRMNLGDPLPANIFVELAKALNPTVVNISTSTTPRQQMRRPPRGGLPRDPFFDFFEQFMGPRAPVQPRQSLGTGFIIRKDGLILTNNHVIDGADVIRVQMAVENESTRNAEISAEVSAEVIGRDVRTDIALIKISTDKDLPVARLGSSKDLQVGEWVAAFGNPFGHSHTMTKGIISAIGREIDEINRFPFIQTDTSINPGNSGGPLVNMKGEVIAVNTAIDARAQGIGFAIPIDEVKSILETLEKEGVVRRGFLGVNLYPNRLDPRHAQELGIPTNEGALIVGTIPNSPAAQSGLKDYDFVTKVGDKTIRNSRDFSRAIADSPAGTELALEIYREGKKQTLKVTLGEHPDDVAPERPRRRTQQGQEAPHSLGFRVANYSQQLAQQFGLPALSSPRPVIIDVEFDSPAFKAGLAVGDIILDVNRKEVRRDSDVFKELGANQINSLRVLRGQHPVLIYVNPR